MTWLFSDLAARAEASRAFRSAVVSNARAFDGGAARLLRASAPPSAAELRPFLLPFFRRCFPRLARASALHRGSLEGRACYRCRMDAWNRIHGSTRRSKPRVGRPEEASAASALVAMAECARLFF